ncbi:MAG: hypothetical protein GX569_03050 [Candidatus Riflebacteria bacterium]|nr:hypothetical protein [Candidatus Riflebacteria bacterium]
MKKLFVLFLLVALVPFSVGCNLWGGDDEAVTYPPKPTVLSTIVTVPAAGLSLLGATPTTYAGYYIMVEGIRLPIVDEEGNVLTFSKELTAADEVIKKASLETANEVVTLEIFRADGTSAGSVLIVAEGTTVATINVTVPAAGVPVVTLTDGTTVVTPIVVEEENLYTITSVTNGDPAVAVSATNAVTVVDGNIDFLVTVSNSVNAKAADAKYSVTVSDKAVTENDFEIIQEAAGTTFTIRIPAAERVADKAYTVKIDYIAVDGKLLDATSFSFKMPAAQ